MSTVSVIIPCYNHAKYLAETLESVERQSHPADEILVVDDGSSDGSAEVAARFAAEHPRVRVLTQANAGRSAAANHGLRESCGEFVVFLDADDRLRPEALALGLKQLADYPEAALAAGHCVLIDAGGLPMQTLTQPLITHDYYARMLEQNFLWNPGNVLFRRSAVEAVGGFNETVRHAEDYAIYLKIARNQPFACYADVVAEYRQHSNNKSSSAHTMLQTVLRILEGEAPFAARTPHTEAARQEGIRKMKWFYGERCITQFYAHLGPGGSRKKAWATLETLLRFYPRGFLRDLKGRLFSRAAGRRLA